MTTKQVIVAALLMVGASWWMCHRIRTREDPPLPITTWIIFSLVVPAVALAAVLKRDDIHLVDVSTPNDSHAPLSISALKAGKHVLCEKPITVAGVWAKPSFVTSSRRYSRDHLTSGW